MKNVDQTIPARKELSRAIQGGARDWVRSMPLKPGPVMNKMKAASKPTQVSDLRQNSKPAIIQKHIRQIRLAVNMATTTVSGWRFKVRGDNQKFRLFNLQFEI